MFTGNIQRIRVVVFIDSHCLKFNPLAARRAPGRAAKGGARCALRRPTRLRRGPRREQIQMDLPKIVLKMAQTEARIRP